MQITLPYLAATTDPLFNLQKPNERERLALKITGQGNPFQEKVKDSIDGRVQTLLQHFAEFRQWCKMKKSCILTKLEGFAEFTQIKLRTKQQDKNFFLLL